MGWRVGGWQSNATRIKTVQLWGKSKEDLQKQLLELKTELGQLRVQKISGGNASKLNKMYIPFSPLSLSLYPEQHDLICCFVVGTQTRPSQIHRPRTHSHQRQPARAAAHLLQEQEIRPARSPPQGHQGHPKALVEAWIIKGDGEAAEEGHTLSPAEICCQGVTITCLWLLGWDLE